MNDIPIKIDLSVFFDDERQKVLLIYNSEWRTVQCLQKRVEQLFDLESDVRFLSDDGCFIPPEESIEVIKFCTGLKAFIGNDVLQKKKTKKDRTQRSKIHEPESPDIIENDYCATENVKDLRKRKYRSLESGFASSTPNGAKRIKNDVCLSATLGQYKAEANKSSEISSTSEPMPPPPAPAEKSKSKKKSCKLSTSKVEKIKPIEEKSISEEPTNVETESSPSHDHSTISERKSSTCSGNWGKTTENHETTPPTARVSLPSSTFIDESRKPKKKKQSTKANAPLDDDSPKTKHIYYDESGEISTTTDARTCSPDRKEEKPKIDSKVLFYCALKDRESKKPRIFQIKGKQLNCEGTKPTDKVDIEIQEDIILSPVDIQQILNKSPEEWTEMPSLADRSKKQDPANVNDQSSADEGNCSLNYDSNSTANTTIDKHKNISMKDSLKSSPQPDCEEERTCSSIETKHTKEIPSGRSKENEKTLSKNGNGSGSASVDGVPVIIDVDDEVFEPKTKRKTRCRQLDVTNSDSDIEEVEEIIDLNETEEPNNTRVSSIDLSRDKYTNIKIHKILPYCKKLIDVPAIGDVLIFKVPYQSSRGLTCYTDFLAGEVECINRRTKSVKLLILDGYSELCYIPGKYRGNFDDSMCDQKYLQMKPSDMKEPKIWQNN